MAHNPLLGSRISLISKKNIRYEGTLYSINEADATVALQTVRAYGTEGREPDPDAFLPPQDAVHPYLLFRGCDIKDLHVHESTESTDSKDEVPADPAIVSAKKPEEVKDTTNGDANGSRSGNQDSNANNGTSEATTADNDANENDNTNDSNNAAKVEKAQSESDTDNKKTSSKKKSNAKKDESEQVATGDDANTNTDSSPKSNKSNSNKPSYNRRKKNNSNSNNNNSSNNHPKQMVGSGASLLRRKVRGVVDDANGPENANKKNFDFESNLAEFAKDDDEEEEDNDSDEEENHGAYDKNNFFDSISCDVSDRQNGVDNRLRGKQERTLNTETFGATSLGYGRRNNRRYRGGRGGRGRGRSRHNDRNGDRHGDGHGRGGGGRPRENNRWKEGSSHSARGRNGNRRTYGDGGLSAHNANSGQ